MVRALVATRTSAEARATSMDVSLELGDDCTHITAAVAVVAPQHCISGA